MRKFDEEEERYLALIMRWLHDDYRSGDEGYERKFDFAEKKTERLWTEAKKRYEKEVEDHINERRSK